MSNIAKRLGVYRSTAERLIDMYEETQKAFHDEELSVNDMAKNCILSSIQKGDVASAKWWSARKNKAEGFGDEPIVVQNNLPAQTTQDIKKNLDKLTVEEREMYFELCEKMNNDADSE